MIRQLQKTRRRNRLTADRVRVRYAAVLSLVVWCTLCVGCGKRSKLPERAPVSGVVTLDGKPVPTGEVTFVPYEGPAASGKIDAEGRYELTTDHQAGGGDGAVIGKHRVRVRARTTMDPGAPSTSLIPLKYGDHARSGLTAEVIAGEDNVIDLKLVSP